MTTTQPPTTQPPLVDRVASRPVIDVRGLTVAVRRRRGVLTLVDGVDLEIHRGETLGLVGESGSGKTMTGLAMMSLLPPRVEVVAGSVEVAGTNMVGLARPELDRIRGAEIGMIFQEPRRSLDPAFTVGFQIAETIRAHRAVTWSVARREAAELLDLVRIDRAAERAAQYPYELSGGMCQRVMLAIALSCRPQVLVADEPTTALDVTVQAAMLRLMAELQTELDLAVLLITHDLGVVAETCDRVAVMYAGQIVEQGPVDAVFERPRHPYTAGLYNSVPDAAPDSRRISFIPGTVPHSDALPTGCRFHPRCTHAVPDCAIVAPQPVPTDSGTSRCLRTDELDLGGEIDGTA